MNLNKAIELLSDSAYGGITTFNQDYKDAQRLGIEAMKRIQHQRTLSTASFLPLLKGETIGKV